MESDQVWETLQSLSLVLFNMTSTVEDKYSEEDAQELMLIADDLNKFSSKLNFKDRPYKTT